MTVASGCSGQWLYTGMAAWLEQFCSGGGGQWCGQWRLVDKQGVLVVAAAHFDLGNGSYSPLFGG